MRGQTFDSVINGTLYILALSWVGLPYAVLVGSFSGLANAVPVIGPSFSCLIAVSIAVLSQSANPFLIIAVFASIHLIDVMFIYPRTVGHSLSLHEGVVIVGVIVGGHVGGILGMLLAVPLLGIVLRSLRITYSTLKGYRIF